MNIYLIVNISILENNLIEKKKPFDFQKVKQEFTVNKPIF